MTMLVVTTSWESTRGILMQMCWKPVRTVGHPEQHGVTCHTIVRCRVSGGQVKIFAQRVSTDDGVMYINA